MVMVFHSKYINFSPFVLFRIDIRCLLLSIALFSFFALSAQSSIKKSKTKGAGSSSRNIHYALPFRYHDSLSIEIIHRRKEAALEILKKIDTLKSSPYWPNVRPDLFFSNLKDNLNRPSDINQGKSTNFCGYAAFSHILLVYMPDIYVRIMLELYENGTSKFPDKVLQPSNVVRIAAGTLIGKGELDIKHADQLWFLTLADQFKGYLNLFDKRYQPGDENLIWAATNYAKFNRMLEVIGGYRVESAGSDLIRPWKKDFASYIVEQQKTGLVLLYLNSKLLHPSKFSTFKLRAPPIL
jgi:hypothetical protein